jgi:hypothetical protein
MRSTDLHHLTSFFYGSLRGRPYILPLKNLFATKELLEIEFRKKVEESLYVQVGCCALG